MERIFETSDPAEAAALEDFLKQNGVVVTVRPVPGALSGMGQGAAFFTESEEAEHARKLIQQFTAAHAEGKPPTVPLEVYRSATSVGSVLTFVFFLFVLYSVRPYVYGLARELPKGAELYDLYGLLLEAILVLVPTLLLVHFVQRKNLKEYLGWRSTKAGEYFQWLGIYFALYLVESLLRKGFAVPIEPGENIVFQIPVPKLVLTLSIVVVGPICEELLYRGVAYQIFLPASTAAAVVIPAVIWTSLHTQFGWFTLGFTFIHGVVLGMARKTSGTIFVPIAVHVAHNLFSSLGSLI